MTVPQKHLRGRQLPYPRGKGLGGSSAINFAFYTRGPKEDYDEWARQVNDPSFNWENALQRYKKLEGFKPIENQAHLKYVDLSPSVHGLDGPVKIGVPREWERTMDDLLIAGHENGLPINLDINSGDPIGCGVCPTTGWAGKRTTAATAYLDKPPKNLHIITNAHTTKILFDGKKVIGVHASGADYFAKETILSAGALDTPKLLLLSGIGPKDELAKHSIPSVVELPGVGQNLQDHPHFPMVVQVEDGYNDTAAWNEASALQAAREQFQKDGTGFLGVLNNTATIGFFKGSKDLMASQEFADLPKDVRDFINRPTVPTWEHSGLIPPAMSATANPEKSYIAQVVFGMVPQSRGAVTLFSANPSDPPLCDPNYFSHPFDRKSIIDATRLSYAFLTCPTLAEHTIAPLQVPKSMSDEDIWAFVQEFTMPTWHASCTAKMGRDDDEMAVVGTDFKVRGLEGLRIADMSVAPFLPNCHTVATAYYIGETAAEKLIEEYGLDV
jgi:choline dehydrogenase-like flavoprotein